MATKIKKQYQIETKRINGGVMNCWIHAEGIMDALDNELQWLKTPFESIRIILTEEE